MPSIYVQLNLFMKSSILMNPCLSLHSSLAGPLYIGLGGKVPFHLVSEHSPVRPNATIRAFIHSICHVVASDWSFHSGPDSSAFVKVEGQHCLVCPDPHLHLGTPLVELSPVTGVCARVIESLHLPRYCIGRDAPLRDALLYLGHCLFP